MGYVSSLAGSFSVTIYCEAPWESVVCNWRGDASHEQSSVEKEVGGCMALIHDSFKSIKAYSIHIKKVVGLDIQILYGILAWSMSQESPQRMVNLIFHWWKIPAVCWAHQMFLKIQRASVSSLHHVCRTCWESFNFHFFLGHADTHLLLVGAEEAQVRAEWVKMLWKLATFWTYLKTKLLPSLKLT